MQPRAAHHHGWCYQGNMFACGKAVGMLPIRTLSESYNRYDRLIFASVCVLLIGNCLIGSELQIV